MLIAKVSVFGNRKVYQERNDSCDIIVKQNESCTIYQLDGKLTT